MKIVMGKSQGATFDVDVILNFKGRICVSTVDELIGTLLAEDHGSQFLFIKVVSRFI